MLLQLSHFPRFIPFHLAHPLPPTFVPFSSCSWVIYISSLASTFPIFLNSPCLFSTYTLCYLFSVPFPSLSPSTPLLITLHVISISEFLFLFQLFAQFVWVFCLFVFVLGLVVNTVSLLSFYCSNFLSSFLRQVPLTFHIIRAM